VLTRADELNLVIADLEAVDQTAKRHRHAIDFGRIGFSHHRDAQLWAHRRQGLASEFGRIHDAQLAPGVRQRDEAGVTVW
jgi:hypothetical protein